MKRTRRFSVLVLTTAALLVPAAAADAAPTNCMAQVASAIPGEMSAITADWLSDPLALGNPGMYAHHLAHTPEGQFCPVPGA